MADQNIWAQFETPVHFLKYELKFLFGKRVNFKMYPVCYLFWQIKQIWSTSLYQTYRLYAFTDISIIMHETSHMFNWHNWENA